MAKSKNNRVLSVTGKSEFGNESTPPPKNSLNKALSSPEPRRRTHRCYKSKRTSNNHGNKVRIPLVKLKEPFRLRDCSRDFKPRHSTSIRFWLNAFCIEVKNDFDSSTLSRLVKTLRKI